jgi:hypothetical protein
MIRKSSSRVAARREQILKLEQCSFPLEMMEDVDGVVSNIIRVGIFVNPQCHGLDSQMHLLRERFQDNLVPLRSKCPKLILFSLISGS